MAINDTVPERRNLILISLLTIAFYIGEVELNESISIPMLNLKATNVENIKYLFRVIFLWIAFRYFLVFKSANFNEDDGLYNSPRRSLLQAIKHLPLPNFILNLISSKCEIWEAKGHVVVQHAIYVAYNHQKKEFFFEVRQGGSTKRINSLSVPLYTYGWLLASFQILRVFFVHPFLSSWYVPWILFLYAAYLMLSTN